MACLNFEENRLKTFNFETWPHSFIKPQILAKTGLYFTGPYDRVQCYFCGVGIYDWQAGENEVFEHNKWSPNCPLLRHRSTYNVPMDSGCELEKLLPPPPGYDECGAYTADFPIRMNFENNRLKTFDSSWPHSFIDPKELAKTGCYYIGPFDEVRCNFCGVYISNWGRQDNVVREHYKLSPHCRFLLNHESTNNTPKKGEPAEELDGMLASVIYRARQMKDSIYNTYIDFATLEEGCHAVKKIRIFEILDETHIRVDLMCHKFIIIKLQNQTHNHNKICVSERNNGLHRF